ncbi:MAG: response regulator [Spirochaetota bacterium]|nr:response regulator [Spirochaetota bacterium]
MSKVLVVDDSIYQRNIILEVLSRAGYTCVEAPDGEKGLELMDSEKPDCVVLDINMPKISGEEILKIIRDRKLNLPVIVVSADIQDSMKKSCLELGARDYLNKPVNKDLLLKAISDALK